MCDRQRIVTIDGPSGSGKSTVSRALASQLNYTYLDTGAMYRAVAFLCREQGVDPRNPDKLAAFLTRFTITLLPPVTGGDDVQVWVEGREVGQLLRTPEMGMLASQVSALPMVRSALTRLQQQMGETGSIVAEGRDTGTVVFPRAAWKFYLDASPALRASRRAAQLRSKGELVDEQALLEQIVQRDLDDQRRTIAPLVKAEDAFFIDSSNRSADEVVEVMLARINAAPCLC